jgi:hypothetical protein
VVVIVESLTSNVITNSVALWYLIAFVAAASFVARTEPGSAELAEPDPPSVPARP